jgi:hypothetical protein
MVLHVTYAFSKYGFTFKQILWSKYFFLFISPHVYWREY